VSHPYWQRGILVGVEDQEIFLNIAVANKVQKRSFKMVSIKKFFWLFLFVVPLSFISSNLFSEMSNSKSNVAKLKNPEEMEIIIKKDCSDCRIVQLRDLYEDLQKYFQEKFPKSHPGFLHGDFNGDGIMDYAILIRFKSTKKTIEKFIVLLGKENNSFNQINIDQWDDELYLNNLYLRIAKPGKIKEFDSSRIIKLNLTGIELKLFESASQIYYWDKGKFNIVQTED